MGSSQNTSRERQEEVILLLGGLNSSGSAVACFQRASNRVGTTEASSSIQIHTVSGSIELETQVAPPGPQETGLS
eukprot:109698-Pyramimonas_sp.AAC.2